MRAAVWRELQIDLIAYREITAHWPGLFNPGYVAGGPRHILICWAITQAIFAYRSKFGLALCGREIAAVFVVGARHARPVGALKNTGYIVVVRSSIR